LALARLRNWDVTSAGRVDLYLANSSFVATRIARYYHQQAEILHPPVDTEFFHPGAGSTQDFCLMVSSLSPYKRIDLAIGACERQGVELRIVGEGPERQRLEQRCGPRTRLLGWVDDETLRGLFQQARCFLQPGIEDFGISSVEALACGCPVVALGRGGVLDIVEDGLHGVLYQEADSVGALAAAIDKSFTISFNKSTLKRRAEDFSAARFEDQLRVLMSRRLTGWSLF
jgi:glycosyltransferase involved in cell wall biosynthesis